MNTAVDMLLGVTIGDALGVPYEFKSRSEMKNAPARDMVGYMSHNQPAGTWSDDSSLTFCLAESLVEGYSLDSAAQNFVKWKNNAYWTAHNNVFDIGMTTARAISELESILKSRKIDELKQLRYYAHETDNGNGSLMRILPLLYEIKGKAIQEQFMMVWENSALTHKHIRAAMCCMVYLKVAENILAGDDKFIAYENARTQIYELWDEIDFSEDEKEHFKRFIQNDIRTAAEAEIYSGGYVIQSIEASLWCLLNTASYEEAVLKAINFGHDTDTTAAITGGLAGLLYTSNNIPEYWIASLARMEDIVDLGKRVDEVYR